VGLDYDTDKLEAALLAEFPDRAFSKGESPQIIAIFPGVRPEIGNVQIHQERDWEIVVSIGEITYVEFDAEYDESLSDEDWQEIITGWVIQFLRDLFNDEILMWKGKEQAVCGWTRIERGKKIDPFGELPLRPDCWFFVWSGPCDQYGQR